ncbi:ABC transporter permease [Thauera sp. CAU 1555]|uniref:Transport permease protein n=1 Tax=Thauera sedimentorum TaxID=2767595 RepID=A0ABR9B562_9RHOO|nr:ABC transporter permease [Thauera sedimentorum]MBC9070391.1 ABC transporter permease [Thauera sedimentorum]MBD8501311.1 ABC transporter permease [Thauera sedimentorum]
MHNPLVMFWCNRRLIHSLALATVASRYRSSWLGMLWPVIQPVLMIGVFSFIFSFVMPLRWGSGAGGHDLPLFLYSGFVVFSFFSDVVTRAPTLILEKPHLVRKVVFPVELLAGVSVLIGAGYFLINFVVLCAFLWLQGYPVENGFVFLVLYLPALALGLTGLSWFLSALTVYVHDTAQVIGLAVSALMFFTPVFYPLSSVAEGVRFWLLMNPLTHVIEGLRALVLEDSMPSVRDVISFWVIAGVVFLFGWFWFRRLKGGFSDVL